MAARAELRARLNLDTSAFTRGLRNAQAQSKEFGASLANTGFAAAKASLLAVGAAAAAAGAGLVAGVKNAYDLGGTLSDLSAQTGISAGKLLVLRQAFADTGVGADAVGGTINKMQKFIEGAASGSAAAGDAFTKLGLDLRSVQGLSPDRQFVTLGNAINRIPNPALRSALAMEIFGKTAGKLLSLFGDSGALKVAAESLGKQAQILDKNSATFDTISDRLGRSGLKLQGFFVGVAERLQGTLLPLTEKLDKMDLAAQGQAFGEGLKSGVSALLEALQALEKVDLEKKGRSLGEGLSAGIKDALALINGALVPSVKSIGEALEIALKRSPAGGLLGAALPKGALKPFKGPGSEVEAVPGSDSGMVDDLGRPYPDSPSGGPPKSLAPLGVEFNQLGDVLIPLVKGAALGARGTVGDPSSPLMSQQPRPLRPLTLPGPLRPETLPNPALMRPETLPSAMDRPESVPGGYEWEPDLGDAPAAVPPQFGEYASQLRSLYGAERGAQMFDAFSKNPVSAPKPSPAFGAGAIGGDNRDFGIRTASGNLIGGAGGGLSGRGTPTVGGGPSLIRDADRGASGLTGGGLSGGAYGRVAYGDAEKQRKAEKAEKEKEKEKKGQDPSELLRKIEANTNEMVNVWK